MGEADFKLGNLISPLRSLGLFLGQQKIAKLHWPGEYINGLLQERCNSIANALELCLSCSNPSICRQLFHLSSVFQRRLFLQLGPKRQRPPTLTCAAKVWLTNAPSHLLVSIYNDLFLAWISNHMPCKVQDEITYPFPNFSGCIVEVWEWRSNFILHFITDVITYPCWD